MSLDKWRQPLIIITLILLVGSAFFIRLENFKNSGARTIDEVVYYRMAVQVEEKGLSGYHTIPYAKELTQRGRDLPPYFFQPIFKHPPLFTFSNMLILKMFGKHAWTAVFVSLLCGVLLIPLAYLLSQIITKDWRSSLFAAFLVWMDPAILISSQKIWMDSMIAFFTLIAVYSFIKASVTQRNIYFIFSGIALGLGMNTKYTAGLPIVAFLLYALLYDRNLFRSKSFCWAIGIPFLMLFPWIFWNWLIYRQEFVSMFLVQHASLPIFIQKYIYAIVFSLALIIICVFYWIARFYQSKSATTLEACKTQKRGNSFFPVMLQISSFLLIFVLFFALRGHIVAFLDPIHLPFMTWLQSAFRDAKYNFYLGRLIEFSFIYFFAYIGWLRYRPLDNSKGLPILRLTIFSILLFFIFWRNYQTRYILPVLTLLIIIGVHQVHEFMKWIEQRKLTIRISSKFFLTFLIGYGIYKTMYINLVLSFTNDMCYF